MSGGILLPGCMMPDGGNGPCGECADCQYFKEAEKLRAELASLKTELTALREIERAARALWIGTGDRVELQRKLWQALSRLDNGPYAKPKVEVGFTGELQCARPEVKAMAKPFKLWWFGA